LRHYQILNVDISFRWWLKVCKQKVDIYMVYINERAKNLTIFSFLKCCLPLWIVGYVGKLDLFPSHGCVNNRERKEQEGTTKNEVWCIHSVNYVIFI
jgi:hypothetical protein